MGQGPHRQLEQAWLDRLADARSRPSSRRSSAPKPSELLIANSTSVCLFKLLAAAARARPGRKTILTPEGAISRPTSMSRRASRDMLGLELKAVEPDEVHRRDRRRHRGRHAHPRRLSLGRILRHARDQRRGARGRRADRLGPVAQRRRDRARPQRHRLRSRRRLRLQISERRARRAGLHLRRRAAAGRAYATRSRAGWAMPSPSPSTTTTGRSTGIMRFLTGTPSILALAALDAGLATFDGIAMRDVAAKVAHALAVVHRRGRGALRRRGPARLAPRPGTARQPRRLRASRRLCRHAGADRARRDRRFPRARPDALRLRAALQQLSPRWSARPRSSPTSSQPANGTSRASTSARRLPDRRVPRPRAVDAPRARPGGGEIEEDEAEQDRALAHVGDRPEALREMHA